MLNKPLKSILSLVSVSIYMFRLGVDTLLIVKGYIRKSHVLFVMKEYTKALQAAQEVGIHNPPFFYVNSLFLGSRRRRGEEAYKGNRRADSKDYFRNLQPTCRRE